MRPLTLFGSLGDFYISLPFRILQLVNPHPFIYLIRQCPHLVPGHGAQVRYSLGTNVNTLFCKHTHARIRAWCGCPRTRSQPCTRAPVPCVDTILVSSGESTAVFALLSSCFKIASDVENRIYSNKCPTSNWRPTRISAHPKGGKC